MLMMTKAFTHQAFQPVTINRPTDLFFGDSKSDAGLIAPLLPHEQGKAIIGYSLVFGENLAVIIGSGQPG